MKNLSLFQEKSRKIRQGIVSSIGTLGVGHIGGSLSCDDLLAVLYFGEMRVDPQNPKMEGRDRLVVSKGHAGPAVYAALAEKGYFPYSELFTLNKIGTNLPSHCDMNRTVGIDMTTGSLGQGFSCAAGIAYGSYLRKDGAFIYSLIGDGESQEGQIWEAAMFCAHKKLGNLIAFTDYNHQQIDGTVSEVCTLGDLASKWAGFGWDVYCINGHNHEEIYDTIERAKAVTEKPSMILLETIKGKGISFVEQAGTKNHNMNISQEQMQAALKELEEGLQ